MAGVPSTVMAPSAPWHRSACTRIIQDTTCCTKPTPTCAHAIHGLTLQGLPGQLRLRPGSAAVTRPPAAPSRLRPLSAQAPSIAQQLQQQHQEQEAEHHQQQQFEQFHTSHTAVAPPEHSVIHLDSSSLWAVPQVPLMENSGRFSAVGEHSFNPLFDTPRQRPGSAATHTHYPYSTQRPASAVTQHTTHELGLYSQATEASTSYGAYAQSPTGKVRPMSAICYRYVLLFLWGAKSAARPTGPCCLLLSFKVCAVTCLAGPYSSRYCMD